MREISALRWMFCAASEALGESAARTRAVTSWVETSTLSSRSGQLCSSAGRRAKKPSLT